MSEETYPSRPLVEASARGDPRAREALFARHLPALRAFVRLNAGALLLARESDADLVQSTCREVLEDLRGASFPDESRFKSWLFTSALAKIRDRQRRHLAARRDVRRDVAQGTSSLELLSLYGHATTPSEEAIAREQVQRIEEAYAALPERHREVLTLVRVAGLDHAAVAERLGITTANARQIYYRASARLLALLH